MEKLRGMYIPLPTPFTDTGAVDENAVLALTDFYLETGVHGLFVLGTFGQGPALTPDERKRIAKIVIDRVAGRIPVVIHVGTADTPTTVELAKDAKDKGADVIGVVPPYYFDHLDDEVFGRLRCSETPYLADSEHDPALVCLHAAASTYRIALGPRAGQKVLTWKDPALALSSQKAQDPPQGCVSAQGFSLHANVHCGPHQRSTLAMVGNILCTTVGESPFRTRHPSFSQHSLA